MGSVQVFDFFFGALQKELLLLGLEIEIFTSHKDAFLDTVDLLNEFGLFLSENNLWWIKMEKRFWFYWSYSVLAIS